MARILLVDDEKVARALYGDYLTAAGHEVVAVELARRGPRGARRRARSTRWSPTSSSPRGTGWRCSSTPSERYPGIEVVVITALDKVDPAVRAIKSGAADYLVKPVSPEALRARGRRALATRQLLRENELAAPARDAARDRAADRDHARSRAPGPHRARRASPSSRRPTRVLFVARTARASSSRAPTASSPDAREPLVALLEGKLARGRCRRGPTELPGGLRRRARGDAGPGRGTRASARCVLLFRGDAARERGHERGLPRAATSRSRCATSAASPRSRTSPTSTTSPTCSTCATCDLVLDARGEDRAADGHPVQPALPRPRLLQERQRHPRPPGRLASCSSRWAGCVKGCVRDNDVVARYGGDEYVVLLRDTDSGGALKVGERIRRTIEAHHFLAREGYSLLGHHLHRRGQLPRARAATRPACSISPTARCTAARRAPGT